MLDSETSISINVAAKKLMQGHLELIDDDRAAQSRTYDAEEMEHFRVAYWMAWYVHAERVTRESRLTPPVPWIKPMTDVEAAGFGDTLVDFGQYRGFRVSQLKEQNPQYLHWLATRDDTFRKDLNRYLARDK